MQAQAGRVWNQSESDLFQCVTCLSVCVGRQAGVVCFEEPVIRATIICPSPYMGDVMTLCKDRSPLARGERYVRDER